MKRPYESFEHVLLFGGGEYADETMGRLNETYRYLADDNDQLKKEMVKAYQEEDFDSEKHAELQSRYFQSSIALAQIIGAKKTVFDYGIKMTGQKLLGDDDSAELFKSFLKWLKEKAELEKETPEQQVEDLNEVVNAIKIITDKHTITLSV